LQQLQDQKIDTADKQNARHKAGHDDSDALHPAISSSVT
jgi:hypothetical protein